MKNKRRKDVTLATKFHYLSLAIDEISCGFKRKTDLIGIACQYSSQPKLKREDFNDILNMNISEILIKTQIKS